MTFPSDFPKYRPRQQARSAKINAIDGLTIWLVMASLEWRYVVNQEFIDEHRPAVGGYLVEYDSGYTFFLPAKAFELGFSLDPTPIAETPKEDPRQISRMSDEDIHKLVAGEVASKAAAIGRVTPAITLLLKHGAEMDAVAARFSDAGERQQAHLAEYLADNYKRAAKCLPG